MHVQALCYVAVCSLSGYHNFPRNIINGTIFGKKLLNIKVCFEFLYDFYLKYFSF